MGNILLGDDGIGPCLLREVRALYASVRAVECIEGGTQGLALLGFLNKREALVILDAFASGKKPGEVSVLEGQQILDWTNPRATTAHEGNAGELLTAARLVGDLPGRVFLVGVEPERVRTGLGLSETVSRALPKAVMKTSEVVGTVLADLRGAVALASA